MSKIQSVEPNIADLANGWLKTYKLDYKLEQESLNMEIDQALNDYYSKNGGVGGNRPDVKLLLRDKNLVNYPVLIEYKGYKDKLVKLDADGKVANKTTKNQPDFKSINSYAVNGAVHYANAFFSTILNKQKPILLSVLVRSVDETFKNTSIKLPETADGKIDFDFMESFIAELEAERVAELEAERVAELSAYLTVSGLDNYELSSSEVHALQNFKSLTWKKFNLEKLFGKSTRGKRLKGDDRIPGTLPFVTAGEAAEGISAYISNNVEIFEKNTTTIDMFGSAKYRNYRYGADDHVAVVHTEKLSMDASIFVTGAIHKAAHTGKFNYGHNFYAKDADALDIMLPVKNGVPDYISMSTLISAIRKLVIKDVVLYTNRKVSAAKKITKKKES